MLKSRLKRRRTKYELYFLTVIEGHTREYKPKVVAVRTERSEVHIKMTQYYPVQLEQARLVSSLLYGTRVRLLPDYF